jgi:adenine-specific DNA-methyltransferase
MDKQSEIEKLKAEVERLKRELKKKKKYGLVWEDKPEEVVEMCKEKLPVLKEVKDKEIITDKDKPVNLLIEGDNYHVLSVLNYTHAGKVDVIYIDPPYNTGNKDFIFNDHYVDREDAYRHSKWLSFMEKRLKLAKNLLKDTGVIFISIDDNEVAQLKLLMDHPDLFGENNFIANIIRLTGSTRNMAKNIDIRHDYLLVYVKNLTKFQIKGLQRESGERFLNPDKDPEGEWSTQDLTVRTGGFEYEIPSIDGTKVFKRKWRFNLERMKIMMGGNPNESFEDIYRKKAKKVFINDREWFVLNKVVFKGPQNVPNLKKYLRDVQDITINSLWNEIESQKKANEDLQNIFNGKKVFDNPKPIGLILKILKICTNKNSVILDFMAGSGTTGQAVLELNKEDGGNRQFILCTNNENNICTDVCYPRIKKVIEGYKNLKGEQVEGLGGNLKYFKTDFVDAEPTDRNKIKLTHQATEMLCVKEGTFEKVIDNERFKIFKNSNHYTGIIWDQTAIPEFKKVIKDIKAKFSVYVFSLGDETFDEEFADVKQKVKLSPIPEAILRVYRRIFK